MRQANKNPNARQYFGVSSFKKQDKDSGLQSITSIYGDSSNDVNPEENPGNEGMIQSHLISVRKSGMFTPFYE